MLPCSMKAKKMCFSPIFALYLHPSAKLDPYCVVRNCFNTYTKSLT